MLAKALWTFILFLLISVSSFAQESSLSKEVCVEKNILLQGHFTVNIRLKRESCEKNEEEMKYERKKDGTLILLPLPKISLEEAPSSGKLH